MPPKKIAAPVDRPLSKAYLRGFDGWSTAYPPEVSEPNSLRVMNNVMITREEAARVRPGLRTYMQTKAPLPIVGSHEVFYTDNGKAYIVAVRETLDAGTDDEREALTFRVLATDPEVENATEIEMLTLAQLGFEQLSDTLELSGEATYVRYLQIDNKIYAMSNAPDDEIVMFWVGTRRQAKKLQNILRPEWTVDDKLTVFHADGAWVAGSIPSATRRNVVKNPDFEANINGWTKGHSRVAMWHSGADYHGTRSLGIRSLPLRTNYVKSPLHSPDSTGLTGWQTGPRLNRISVQGTSMRLHAERQATDSFGYVMSERLQVPGGKRFKFAFDLTGEQNARKWMTAVRFFRRNGDRIGGTTQVGGNRKLTNGRRYSKEFVIPSQARYMRILIGVAPTARNVNAKLDIKNVTLNEASVSTAALDGDDGADHYWTGNPNDSRSVHHPGRDVWVDSPKGPATAGKDYIGSSWVLASAGVQIEVQTRAYNSSGSVLATQTASDTATGGSTWQRLVAPVLNAPAGTTKIGVRVIARDLERDERLYVDGAAVINEAVDAGYFSGNTAKSGDWKYRWAGAKNNSISIAEEFAPIPPVAETPSSSTLVSSDSTKNTYSFRVWYTISNEFGESAASQDTVIRTQRSWTTWKFTTPGGADTNNPELCADQLIVRMPQEVFDAALAANATHWTAYVATWGPNDVPVVTGTRFAEVALDDESTYDGEGFARITPRLPGAGAPTMTVPSEATLFNATDPRKGSQGLVAADRLVLVGAPNDPAKISWSSGSPGDYANFSDALGGGEKQLTSGNLYLTACVKLWQNPQSVDTLTILTRGDDGRSTAYYMQPATITTLSETIQVMGFEEVSGMSGTVSPYGCEVVNNGLYRPEFHGLTKSTANNYNVSHRSVSDTIENMWRTLQQMHRIVSASLDSRIYYLVHNIFGETLEDGCNGNEVWVIDVAAKTPHWSRWSVQGNSLRTMDVDGVVMMSVVRPDGIFTFHPDRYTDDMFDDAGVLQRVNIPWYLETNTQGANRAHDAWANLQQANVMLGNFEGELEYGVRGKDVNGMDIDIKKRVVSSAPPPDLTQLGDDLEDTFKMPTLNPDGQEDYFLVRKIMKQWVFYAGSVYDEVDVTPDDDNPDDTVLVPRSCGGQISAVQYRYTPATVNVGYEYGSVETFEYGAMDQARAVTDSGTPLPYVDRQP